MMFEFILIVFMSVPALCLYFYFIRNFNFWKNLGIPYVKPVPFFGSLKDCVLQRVFTGKYLKKIYDEHNDKPYVGIFSLDNPSLLVRNPELVKNILVKDFQNFMDRQISTDEKTDPLWANAVFVKKSQRWREIRTNFTPLFTTGKMKTMFCLVNLCGKDLAACLEKATAEETLRKYPVLTFLDTKCCIDYELPTPTGNGTITLPAGIALYIPVLALHHNPTYFPDPEKFDPELFTEENKQSRPNYTYIPFGEGPRKCIGIRFGQMQVKAGLCHILYCFEVAPCKETTVPIVYNPKSFLLQENREILLSFNKIQ